jgi:hypothetical protein
MSKCTSCGGTGTMACATCHGQGFTTRVTEDGETVQRLCGMCAGKRQMPCTACRGTGEAVVRPPTPAPTTTTRPQAPVDRLAGRWKGFEGTWYEFVPDGNRYRVTGGGLRDIMATGTATLDATDKLLGHYTIEMTLRGNHLEGIDRKAGFPIPVTFVRV